MTTATTQTDASVDVFQTTIPTAGVMRCCLASVACEHLDAGRKVSEGERSSCVHCKRTFTLRKPIRGKMVWYPDDFHTGSFPFNPANC